jgi:holo-[acyl-carrier protein] synthase
MLLGIGTDFLAIARVHTSLTRFGERFTHKVFTAHERATCGQNAARYAKRLAAKEAVLKALGTGVRSGFSWQDIEIWNDALGAPGVRFSAAMQQRLQHRYGTLPHAWLSLSDEQKGSQGEGYAMAMVVLTTYPTVPRAENI